MKNYLLYPLLFVVLTFSSCDKDEDSFDNKIYLDSQDKVGELLLEAGLDEKEMFISTRMAKPEEEDVNITYKTDVALVSQYNEIYYDNAVALPDNNYELLETSVVIKAGNVRSKEVGLKFKNLLDLDRDIVYVLPVSILNSDVSVLESSRTLYYVIKGAALINVVGDIEENYLTVNWINPDVCNNLSQLTMEALIRARDFDRLISTVMGIEGKFLIRIGDAGFPSNQIQIATSGGNFPDADSNKGLPTNEWVHVALTYNSTDGALVVYINGVKQSEGTKFLGDIDLGVDGFLIGKSYADDRFLAGEISECRIWNVVRTSEQIGANPYYVDPTSEGLVAYWKFNEGSGDVIQDATGNGNYAKANKPIVWNPVSLPVSDKK